MAGISLEDLDRRISALEEQDGTETYRLFATISLQNLAIALALKKISQIGTLRDDDISEWKRRLELHAEYLIERNDEETPGAGEWTQAQCTHLVRDIFEVIDEAR